MGQVCLIWLCWGIKNKSFESSTKPLAETIELNQSKQVQQGFQLTRAGPFHTAIMPEKELLGLGKSFVILEVM